MAPPLDTAVLLLKELPFIIILLLLKIFSKYKPPPETLASLSLNVLLIKVVSVFKITY
jgi:hypothetical protein